MKSGESKAKGDTGRKQGGDWTPGGADSADGGTLSAVAEGFFQQRADKLKPS